MTTQFIWKIVSLQVTVQQNSLQKVITTVYYHITATNGDKSITHSLVRGLLPPSEDNFVPYESLSEEQVLGWVKSQMGEDGVREVEADVERRLMELINPPILHLPPPWVQPQQHE